MTCSYHIELEHVKIVHGPTLRSQFLVSKCLETVHSHTSQHHGLSKKYKLSLASLDPASPHSTTRQSPSLSITSASQFLYAQAIRDLIEHNTRWKKSRKHESILDINGSSGEAREAKPGDKRVSVQRFVGQLQAALSSISSCFQIWKPLRSASSRRLCAPSSVLFQTFLRLFRKMLFARILLLVSNLRSW